MKFAKNTEKLFSISLLMMDAIPGIIYIPVLVLRPH